jgi:hypothetical protein
MQQAKIKILKLIGKVFLVLGAMFIVFTVFAWNPLYHVLFMSFFLNPCFSIGGLILLIGLLLVFTIKKNRYGNNAPLLRSNMIGRIVGIVLLVFGFTWGIIGGIATPAGMVTAHIHHEIKDSIEYIDTLPNTAEDNVRMMPYAIAENKIISTLNFTRYKLGSFDFVLGQDGKLFWNAAIIPEGFLNSILSKPRGAIFVDATKTDYTPITIDSGDNQEAFPFSDGIRWADNIYWRSYNLDYWASYSDPYYLMPETEDGDIVAVISKTKYHFAWYGGFWPIRVPHFAGVYLFFPDETHRWVSSDRIDEEPLLNGQQVFPENLARRISESFAYPHSIGNTIGRHQDQQELADIPSEGNKFPYFIALEDESPTWFTALEPNGETFGLKSIVLIDGRTGHVRVWRTDEDQPVVGAVKALDHIKSNTRFQNTKWYDGGEGSDGFIVIEPLPIIRNGELWWKAVITRLNKIAITNIAFVNAMNPEQVTVVQGSDEAYRFIRGESIALTESVVEVINFAEAIERIDAQITQLESVPNDLMSPVLQEQLDGWRAIRPLLIAAKQATQNQLEPIDTETD